MTGNGLRGEHSGEPLDPSLKPAALRYQAGQLTAEPHPLHPLAELFPLIEGEEFDKFVASIKAHGLRDPIIIHDGMILDGRNRQRACQAAGVDCAYQPLPAGQDPLAFVIDRNLTRRHLTNSQRAMIATKLANLKDGQTKAGAPIGAPVSQQDAAEKLKVSRRSIQRAAKVKDNAIPEVTQAVERGDLTVSAAAEIAELPKAEQQTTVASGKLAIRSKANKQRTNWTNKPVRNKGAAKAALSTLAWSEATLGERRHFLDGIGFQSMQEAMPLSWRAPLDDLSAKLADRDFLEFTRKTALRVRRYGVTGLVANKELIDAASDAAKAWGTIFAQLKTSYGDGVEAVSAGIKNETVAAANILDDLSIPNILMRIPSAGDEEPPK